jgi:hypothetical protein
MTHCAIKPAFIYFAYVSVILYVARIAVPRFGGFVLVGCDDVWTLSALKMMTVCLAETSCTESTTENSNVVIFTAART